MTINFPGQKTWHHAQLLKHLPQARKKDQDVIVRPALLLIGPLDKRVRQQCSSREVV